VSDIFNEINEDLRQERLINLWNKYKNAVMSGILTIIIGTGAFVYWQNNQVARLQEASSDYMDAILTLSSGNMTRALEILESTPQKSGQAYADLSKLLGAGILREKGDKLGAIEAYKNLILTASTNVLKEFAQIMLCYLQVDEADPKELLDALKPSLSPKSSWYPSALEISALAKMRLGQYAEAQEDYKKILSLSKVPFALKARAEILSTANLTKSNS
jgi:hypothetical protein